MAAPASAHSPVPGMEGFYRGLAQPVTEPAQGLAVAAAGLLIARTDPAWILKSMAAFQAAALVALLILGLSFGAPIEHVATALLGLALLCGAALAIWRTADGRLVGALSLLTGLVAGANALPEPGEGMTVTSAGSLAGLAVLSAYAAGTAAWLKRQETQYGWLHLVPRVAGSWIGAIALLMLAFVARPAPPALAQAGYCATQPPSICNRAPLIWSASGEHRNDAMAATCSGATNCLVGWAARSTSRLTSSSLMPREAAVSAI